MWFLIRYLDRYRTPQTSPLVILGINKVRRGEFEIYLFGKHFIEDWRHFLIRWFYKCINIQQPQSRFIQKLNHKQLRSIKDIVDNCLERGLIQRELPWGVAPSDSYIWTNNKSREFLQIPRFFSAILAEGEYGRLITFIFGVISTGIVGFLVKWWSTSAVWAWWVDALSKVIY